MSESADKSEKYLKVLTLKLCTLGDGGVGKSTFVERVSTGVFNSNTKMTIGIDIHAFHVVLDTEKGKILTKISVWDLGGEDQFRFILPTYLTGADGGLLLYDVSRASSMNNLPDWTDLWRKHTLPGIPLYLIGSKSDRISPSNEPMIQSTMKTLTKQLSIKKKYLASSKTGENIHDVTISIIKDMLRFKKIRIKIKKEKFRFSQK